MDKILYLGIFIYIVNTGDQLLLLLYHFIYHITYLIYILENHLTITFILLNLYQII